MPRYLYKKLRNAERTQYGLIIDKSLAEAETTQADILRQEIVRLLSLEKNLLENSLKSLPFLLNSTIDDHFCSVDERIKKNVKMCNIHRQY